MLKLSLYTAEKDFVAETELRVDPDNAPDAVLWNQRLFIRDGNTATCYSEAKTVMLAAGSNLLPVKIEDPR